MDWLQHASPDAPGLDAEMTADGLPLETTLGRCLFQGPAPGVAVSVLAEWNGFSASFP